MKTLETILRKNYHIPADEISAQQGGWASLAYKVKNDKGELFFMKVYEKSRRSTPYLTQYMDIYLSIMSWLNTSTSLNGKMPRLIKTRANENKCEDKDNIYILFEYLEGSTVGEKALSNEQVYQLADIVSQLHASGVDASLVDTSVISETFSPLFIPELNRLITQKFELLNKDIQEIVAPNLSVIRSHIHELENLSQLLKKQNRAFVLCHTDIHHWNIIVNDHRLYLVDWEGLKFAPPEADIFSIRHQPYFNEFTERYTKNNPAYAINDNALRYYQICRKLQDIWEFIEQLQFDTLDPNARNMNLNDLKSCLIFPEDFM